MTGIKLEYELPQSLLKLLVRVGLMKTGRRVLECRRHWKKSPTNLAFWRVRGLKSVFAQLRSKLCLAKDVIERLAR